jgi:hypothetical protein
MLDQAPNVPELGIQENSIFQPNQISCNTFGGHKLTRPSSQAGERRRSKSKIWHRLRENEDQNIDYANCNK